MIDGVIDKAETMMITIGNLQEWTINQQQQQQQQQAAQACNAQLTVTITA